MNRTKQAAGAARVSSSAVWHATRLSDSPDGDGEDGLLLVLTREELMTAQAIIAVPRQEQLVKGGTQLAAPDLASLIARDRDDEEEGSAEARGVESTLPDLPGDPFEPSTARHDDGGAPVTPRIVHPWPADARSVEPAVVPAAAPVVEAPPPSVQRTARISYEPPQRAWTQSTPPDVAPPRVDGAVGWQPETDGSEGAWKRRGLIVGSASHVGPPTIAAEKSNEDFALHGVLSKGNHDWLVVAVADGVGQSVWPERAAKNTAIAFVEAVASCLGSGIVPTAEDQLNPPGGAPRWHEAFSEVLCERILARLEADLRLLRDRPEPYLPVWTSGEVTTLRFKPHLFERLFFSGPDAGADEIRNRWFQSTLLGGVLGPRGGFAVLLGDGFIRVDRHVPGASGAAQWVRSPRVLQPDTRSPDLRASLRLSPAEVSAALRKVPVHGATEIGILVASDGVSKSSPGALRTAATRAAMGRDDVTGTGLEDMTLSSPLACRRLLVELAAAGDGADLDNMSIAFGRRALGGKGT